MRLFRTTHETAPAPGRTADPSAGAEVAPEEVAPGPGVGISDTVAPRPGDLGAILGAAEHHTAVALQFLRDEVAVCLTYFALGSHSLEIAQGLIALGVEVDDRVSVLGLTSACWTIADRGALCGAAVVTPIHHTNWPEECASVLGHSGARLLRDGFIEHRPANADWRTQRKDR
jgi:long-chain acyl-CoA synthetase